MHGLGGWTCDPVGIDSNTMTDMGFESHALVGSTSQRFGCSLWREDGFRETCVGVSEGAAFWWLALAIRWFPGDVCRSERSHFVGDLDLARKCFPGVVRVGAKITAFSRTHREHAVFDNDVNVGTSSLARSRIH